MWITISVVLVLFTAAVWAIYRAADEEAREEREAAVRVLERMQEDARRDLERVPATRCA